MILGCIKSNSLLKDKIFFLGGKGESDGTQERPQLVKSGHQHGPDSASFGPAAFSSDRLQCRAFIYFDFTLSALAPYKMNKTVLR